MGLSTRQYADALFASIEELEEYLRSSERRVEELEVMLQAAINYIESPEGTGMKPALVVRAGKQVLENRLKA